MDLNTFKLQINWWGDNYSLTGKFDQRDEKYKAVCAETGAIGKGENFLKAVINSLHKSVRKDENLDTGDTS